MKNITAASKLAAAKLPVPKPMDLGPVKQILNTEIVGAKTILESKLEILRTLAASDFICFHTAGVEGKSFFSKKGQP